MSDCCCDKTKVRSEEEKRSLINRLSRIEGQVRGIKAMLEEDKYCIDILTQTSATASALNSFSREILESHIRSCVIDGVKSGDNEKVEELIKAIERFIK
jgi:DNA-binding FrmR family transcriptional regulator